MPEDILLPEGFSWRRFLLKMMDTNFDNFKMCSLERGCT